MYSASTLILMNRPILVNNSLEFYFHRLPKPSLCISSDTKCSSANYKPAAVSSFKQVTNFLASEKLCWKVHEPHGNAFSRSARTLQQFLYIRVVEPDSREIPKMLFVPLLFSNNATICISSHFYGRTIVFVIYMTEQFSCENASSNILCHQVWSQDFLSATWDFQVHLS